jgi:6-phosphofructokinase 1
MADLLDLQVSRLGESRHDSPLAGFIGERRTNEHYVSEEDRVLYHDTLSELSGLDGAAAQWPSFEPGGPRRRLFFEPGHTKVGILTCGGLCPGQNDVIRGIVMELSQHYGIAGATGFRNGYLGLTPAGPPPMMLTPGSVDHINQHGGTVLGTSRGSQDPAVMVDRLVELGIDVLFVIGGDGSMRGASALVREVTRRGLQIGVIGVPKTIDNDIPFIGQSFGFVTAFSRAAQAISVGTVEARSAVGGVGLVKLMGRHSGFIACYAALANHDADVVLIPEVPFSLEGANGLLSYLHQRVKERGSAVVVVAEGAGQGLLAENVDTDESGNARFTDVGVHLRNAITAHFSSMGSPLTLKYIEPSYSIRSVRAEPHDAVYCLRLAQAAVHAGMAGRTDMVVGRRHNRPIHVPISLVISERNQVAPDGDLWMSVLEQTSQPADMR